MPLASCRLKSRLCMGEWWSTGLDRNCSSSESVGVEALRREFLPMGKYNQVKGHRSGETKVFFFLKKGKRVRYSEAQCVGCLDTSSRSIFRHIYPILLLPSLHFFLTPFFLKYTFLMIFALWFLCLISHWQNGVFGPHRCLGLARSSGVCHSLLIPVPSFPMSLNTVPWPWSHQICPLTCTASRPTELKYSVSLITRHIVGSTHEVQWRN